MSSYVTKPKHIVGRCPVLGCTHKQIHFEENGKRPATERAIAMLRRHVTMRHPEFIVAVTSAYIRRYCVR